MLECGRATCTEISIIPLQNSSTVNKINSFTHWSLIIGSVPLCLSRNTCLHRNSCTLYIAAPHIIGTLHIIITITHANIGAEERDTIL